MVAFDGQAIYAELDDVSKPFIVGTTTLARRIAPRS